MKSGCSVLCAKLAFEKAVKICSYSEVAAFSAGAVLGNIAISMPIWYNETDNKEYGIV